MIRLRFDLRLGFLRVKLMLVLKKVKVGLLIEKVMRLFPGMDS